MILFHLCRRWCGNMWYVLVIWCGYLAESSCNILEWELDDVCTCCTGCILNDLKCIQMQHTTVPYWSRHFGLRQRKPWAEILAEMKLFEASSMTCPSLMNRCTMAVAVHVAHAVSTLSMFNPCMFMSAWPENLKHEFQYSLSMPELSLFQWFPIAKVN